MCQALSVLWGRGGTSSLWGVWHQDEALWRGPMPYKGGDGQRPLQRRCLRSLCSALEWRSRADGLIGPGPLLQVSVRGSTWRRCVPPIPEGEGSQKARSHGEEVEGGETVVAAESIRAEDAHGGWGELVSGRRSGGCGQLTP